MSTRRPSKAEQFIRANGVSPIMYGGVLTRSVGGCERPVGILYRLKDGQTFRLTNRDLAALRGIHRPRWEIAA
jgi:hypothetical protein